MENRIKNNCTGRWGLAGLLEVQLIRLSALLPQGIWICWPWWSHKPSSLVRDDRLPWARGELVGGHCPEVLRAFPDHAAGIGA